MIPDEALATYRRVARQCLLTPDARPIRLDHDCVVTSPQGLFELRGPSWRVFFSLRAPEEVYIRLRDFDGNEQRVDYPYMNFMPFFAEELDVLRTKRRHLSSTSDAATAFWLLRYGTQLDLGFHYRGDSTRRDTDLVAFLLSQQ